MGDLDVNEKDLLSRIREKPVLRPMFFKKAKGLKWFGALSDAGYFDAKDLPSPVSSNEEGYITIPRWDALDYLVNAAPELQGSGNDEYGSRFLEIIVAATERARNKRFGNYHAWWQFSLILPYLPLNILTAKALDVVDYWLDDKFETDLVAESVGVNWLPDLLDRNDERALPIASKLLSILFRVRFVERELAGRVRHEASLRFDPYWAKRVTQKVARIAGRRLGQDAPAVFHSSLTHVLDELDNDEWSSIWQPAIEEHEQNQYHDEAQNVLVAGYRESLAGYVETAPDDAEPYLAQLLSGPHQTIQRLAIHCIGSHPRYYNSLWNSLISERYLHSNFRHEFWHLLNKLYDRFSTDQKKRILKLISEKIHTDDDGAVLEGASAYERSCWLAAIKDSGPTELGLYRQAISTTKTEPEHPDFSSYFSSGWRSPESPYSPTELTSLSVSDLVHLLATFEGGGGWREPGIEGLSRALKETIVTSPLAYHENFGKLVDLDLAYVHSIIDAYYELWRQKAKLPWDDIWKYLLSYISDIVEQVRFWEPGSAKQREQFVANRHWVVSLIGRLLQAATRSDDHAIEEEHHSQVESVLKLILEKEPGEEFDEESDAVSIAINSPRGQCIESLINLTLRSCRLEDKRTGGQHTKTWSHFQSYYDNELRRSAEGEYEFAALVTNYIANFLYMSRKWVLENLDRIFDNSDRLKWLCAMQGYAYVGTVDRDIYEYLKKSGHALQVLDECRLKERTEDKIIQSAVAATLYGIDNIDDEDSLLLKIIRRNDFDELSHLIWFIWTIRGNDGTKARKLTTRLWPMIQNSLDLTSAEGQKLASALCDWSVFVKHIDDKAKELLLAIAPYAHVSFNSRDLLESLANLSDKQPFEVNEIWQAMLQGAAMDYPPESINTILENLVSQGKEGLRAARDTVSIYLEKGMERPSLLLQDVMERRD